MSYRSWYAAAIIMKMESDRIIYLPSDLIRYLPSPFAFSAFRSMLHAPRPMLFRQLSSYPWSCSHVVAIAVVLRE